MDNNSNMLQLCRLCLVKDDVNIPIFEEQGDIRQIFLKISSCLPVKVSRDDRLPKKICDGCSYKLDMLYEFWNTSANAEKQLLTWLGEAGMTSQMADGTISAVAQQIKPADTFVKQETVDPPDIHMDDDEDEDKDYLKEEENSNNVEEPPPKRARRTAAVKAAIALDQNSDDDDDSGEPMTKIEDDSEDSDNEDHEPAFVDVPSTSADDQPGPSGVGKDGVEAPDDSEVAENIYIVVSTNQQTQTRQQPPFCNVCEKNFGTPIKYAKHSMKHSLDGIFRCFICHVTAKMTLDQIETHIRIHQNKPKYTCTFCQARLFSKYSAIKHEYCHTGIKGSSTVFCEICSKGFMFFCSLQAHVKESHPESVVKYQVKDGTRVLVISKSLSTKEHLPIPIYPTETIICNKCDEIFEDNIKYASHTVTHSEDGQFNCYLCALQSKMSEIEIVDHIKMHLNATIHQCSVCNRGFSRRIDAMEHVNFHSGDKPYECNICNKRFMFTRCLLSHRKNHHNLTSKWIRGCTACDTHML